MAVGTAVFVGVAVGVAEGGTGPVLVAVGVEVGTAGEVAVGDGVGRDKFSKLKLSTICWFAADELYDHRPTDPLVNAVFVALMRAVPFTSTRNVLPEAYRDMVVG